MIPEFLAAIQSAKALTDIAKAGRDLANYNELAAAISDVHAKLMAASAVALVSQEKQAALASRIHELESELKTLRADQMQADKYALHQFATGALAYQPKVPEPGVPMHYVCAKCFDAGKHTKLQPRAPRRLQCHECHITIQTDADPPIRSSDGGFTKNW